MSYWMIYVRDNGVWSPQFGDHDRECVQQEREDQYLKQPGTSYDGDGKYRARDIKIVKLSRATNADIDRKTEELNRCE